MSHRRRARAIFETEPQPGWFNMAGDAFMAESIGEGDYPAALRFYTWSPPAVSIGINQKPEVIVRRRCLENGWDIVRRPTGGRALLHLQDLSYAVAMRVESGSYQELKTLYQRINAAALDACRALGLRDTGETDAGSSAELKLRSGLCLDTRVRGELLVGGRKLAAAAQHIRRGCVLQHGSIMLDGDPGAIAEVAALTESEREQMALQLRARAVTLRDLISRRVSPEGFAGELASALENQLGLELEPQPWTDSEFRSIEALRGDWEIVSAARLPSAV